MFHRFGFVAMIMATGVFAESPLYESHLIFKPTGTTPDHVHASCIVECPNGDLLAVWYENGTPLPPPYYLEEGDKGDDVRIAGARFRAGAEAWNAPFVMVDTFGVSDNNPCMVIDRDKRLWLVYATLLGVPESAWGSALVQYRVSEDYMNADPPTWSTSSILVPHPTGLDVAIKNTIPERFREREGTQKSLVRRLRDPYRMRLGWMPRAHPLVRSDGAVLLPLANENHGVVSMAITEDVGETWTISEAVPLAGLEQPTVAESPDGTLLCFFRSADDEVHIRRSVSRDGGMTWTVPEVTDLVHPFSGLEIVYLKNGHLALIYNDQEKEPRDRLAVSISIDDGKTWQWTRHLENIPGGRFDYPSLIQAEDGTLHATYSYNLKTVKHVHFNEAWVQEGDE